MNNEIKLDYIQSLVQDEDMVKDLINTFYEDGPEDFKTLEEAIRNRDYENARIYAHKLKSSLAIFKVEPLRTACETAEMKCKSEESFESIEKHVSAIKIDMSSLFERLNALR